MLILYMKRWPDNDNEKHAGYFQLLSRAESIWYDTIVKLLLQSAAVVCFVPLLVSLVVLLCSLVAALLEFATRSIAFFKLALMGFHLSWMPYTFKIYLCTLYIYIFGEGEGGVHTGNWARLGLGLPHGHSTGGHRFILGPFNLNYRSDIVHLPADRWDSQSIVSICISRFPFVFLFAFAKPCPRTI